MPSFLFTATNAHQQIVNERVEAQNLSQARHELEVYGYTAITFFESELSEEVVNLFDERATKNRKKFLNQQVDVLYNSTCSHLIWKNLKMAAFIWLMLSVWVYLGQTWISYFVLGLSVIGFVYLILPVILFQKLVDAHCWAKNVEVRFWAKAIMVFNTVSFFAMPRIEVDFRLACADAREGNLNDGLLRLNNYLRDPKVSSRILNSHFGSVYENARMFDKVLEWREKSLEDGNNFPEEMLDYAICLARYHKRTREATEILEKVVDMDMNFMAIIAIPYCRGIIEVEEGNFSQAEFYLRQAAKEIEPFGKNTYLVGFRNEIKAYLCIALGRAGAKDEATKIYNEARGYLRAQTETELTQRCEDAIR